MKTVYNIEDFRKINKSENIVISLHGQLRLNERNITVDDVINAINNGEIIEQYVLWCVLPLNPVETVLQGDTVIINTNAIRLQLTNK